MRQSSSTKFAKGSRGDWFVTLRNGERLPCLVKEFWRGGNVYHEEFYYDLNKPKHADFIEAIHKGRVVMARYEMVKGTLKRVGYIEGRVFKVADVRNEPDHGLSCNIVGSEIVS